jgi:hypothetical protein
MKLLSQRERFNDVYYEMRKFEIEKDNLKKKKGELIENLDRRFYEEECRQWAAVADWPACTAWGEVGYNLFETTQKTTIEYNELVTTLNKKAVIQALAPLVSQRSRPTIESAGPGLTRSDDEILTTQAPEWKPQWFVTNTDPSKPDENNTNLHDSGAYPHIHKIWNYINSAFREEWEYLSDNEKNDWETLVKMTKCNQPNWKIGQVLNVGDEAINKRIQKLGMNKRKIKELFT